MIDTAEQLGGQAALVINPKDRYIMTKKPDSDWLVATQIGEIVMLLPKDLKKGWHVKIGKDEFRYLGD